MRLLMSAALAALLAAPAFAIAAPLAKADPASFPASKAKIEKALSDGKTYSELSRTQREEVIQALERMDAALSSGVAPNDMRTEQKIQLVNDQEFINTTLTQASADSRLICRQERKTGSHRTVPRCATVGQMRRERERSQEEARRFQVSSMKAPGE